MYKFVKIQRKGSNDGHWYFKPESEEQVVEHFNKIFGSEIRDGVHDHFEHSHLILDKSEPDGNWMYSLLKLEQICSLSISCFNLSLLFRFITERSSIVG